MRVVVTGGAGFIGSHVARALLEEGHDVVVLDDLSTGHRWLVRAVGVPLVEGCVSDPDALARALPGADAVVHLAGRAIVAESVRDPGPYFDVNVERGRALLEGLLRHDVRRVVFSSTCAVYGVAARLPLDEDTPCAPVNPYGASKLAFEQVLAAYAHAHGLRALALRYFNAAGAGAGGDLGEVHEPETHLIPSVLLAAAAGRPVEVCGTDFPTRDGTAERDYIHVEDLARAHIAALHRVCAGPAGAPAAPGAFEVMNVGLGHGHTVREVIAAVEAALGRPVATVDRPRRPGDPPALVASAERARAALGFRPRHGLEAMIRSAWRFLERHAAAAPTPASAPLDPSPGDPPMKPSHPNGQPQPGQAGASARARRLRFGEAVVAAGHTDADQVTRALEIQRARDATGESHKLLGIVLLEMGAISNEQLIGTLKLMQQSSQPLPRLSATGQAT